MNKKTQRFVEQAELKHNNKYDYSHVEYVNCKTKVKILCKSCGSMFFQTPNKHLNLKIGCPVCAKQYVKQNNANRKKTTEEFIEQCRLVHKDRFDYSKTKYVTRNTPVEIRCKHCNTVFFQLPDIHLKTSGCKTCSNVEKSVSMKKSQQTFIEQCVEKYGSKYDYCKVNYIDAHTLVEIKCNQCGNYFFQRPYSHLNAEQGCPYCSCNNTSKLEQQWLDYMGVPNDRQHRQVHLNVSGKRLKVDAFVPQTNTVYEFWGDFWHGNPHKFNPDEINPVTKTTYKYLHEKNNEET